MIGQAFRRRFKDVGEFLGLAAEASDCPGFGQENLVLDLGGLRAGGATDLYQATEDFGLVQQRGGWADRKVMRIYLQELASSVYLSRLRRGTRRRVDGFARLAPCVWDRAFAWAREGVPSTEIPARW